MPRDIDRIDAPGWEEAYANQGIVGLSQGPWNFDPDDFRSWPTHGYDGDLTRSPTEWDEKNIFVRSGHTREEWIALADMMILRWKAWRRHIESLDPNRDT